jgi:long-chain acyl-CoA synthetase
LDDVLARSSAQAPAVEVDPDDFATILYTSGTTSHPKGVLGTHRNICVNAVSLRYVGARGALRAGRALPAESPAPSVVLVPVPLFHGTGCHSNLVAQAYFGGTVVLMRRWDPEAALDLIERERVTGLSGVPAMAWDLVHAPSVAERDLSSLLSLGGGGAAAPPELLRRIQTVLPRCGSGTGYGMTESSSLTSSIGGADYAARPTSVGVPVPICDVKIVDEAGGPVPAGEVGEIWMKGATVVPGYWNRPEATTETFTDGWLHSGDLGRLDDEGFLYIVDRAKDMVIRGGENISSIEVEAALFEHPAVIEAAVFSVPHQVLGEEVGAVVRPKDGATVTVNELRAHAGRLLAPFKVPAHIWLTDQPLPRGATGKVQKREIRAERVAAGGAR